jgi:hypothetical protein
MKRSNDGFARTWTTVEGRFLPLLAAGAATAMGRTGGHWPGPVSQDAVAGRLRTTMPLRAIHQFTASALARLRLFAGRTAHRFTCLCGWLRSS